LDNKCINNGFPIYVCKRRIHLLSDVSDKKKVMMDGKCPSTHMLPAVGNKAEIK